jgi:mRNA interferase MazF
MIPEPWDVVVVPFPFADRRGLKRRPALVMSQAVFNQDSSHSVLAMITSSPHSAWPSDTPIFDPQSAGLHVPCVVRFKLFTLDNRLIIRRLGRLGPADERSVATQLRAVVA